MANLSFVRVLARAKGFAARSKNCRTVARNAVERSMRHETRNRKLKHRNFKASWIRAINAGARDAAQTEPLTFKAMAHHVIRQTQATPGFRPLPVIKTHQDHGLLVSNVVAETIPKGKLPFIPKARRRVANYY